MKDRAQIWLVIGALLIFVGVNSIVTGATANRFKGIIYPYIVLPIGVLVLARGLVGLARLRDRPRKWIWGLSYSALTLALCFLLRWVAAPSRADGIQPVVSGWPHIVYLLIVILAGLLGIGLWLRWVVKRH